MLEDKDLLSVQEVRTKVEKAWAAWQKYRTYSQEQIDGWRKVTSAVHARGARVVLQLWHVGRISHSSFQPERALPSAER